MYYVVTVKLTVKILSIFVTYLDNMNFYNLSFYILPVYIGYIQF